MQTQKTLIRQATPLDLANIKACAKAAYARYIERMQKEPAPMNADFVALIAEGSVYISTLGSSIPGSSMPGSNTQATAMTGYVVFYPQDAQTLHLENIAVLPEYSGCGIGKALIDYVEEVAVQGEFQQIELYTNEAMTENLSMYPKLGYLETERKSQDGFNRVFFRKALSLQNCPDNTDLT